MTDIGAVIDDKYEILKQIGKGGMSVVYLAMDKRLNKQWAVKEIKKMGNGKSDEVVINSLLAEANLMKKLDHPALPRIVDIIDNGTTIYIIMDYIEGESLDKILLEYGAQPEEIVIEWGKQLCDALSYLHSQKPPIIYRDMKPANVMLKPEGNLKVIDFGIAREYKEGSLADTTILGTKGYASPEHYGSRQTDARSDIYTLGMTLHHLITGVDPRTPDYKYVPVRQWNPKLSEGIEVIIDKCTAINPDDRYQNCSELMYDLEHPDLITKDYKRKQRRKLIISLSMMAVTIIMLLSGILCRFFAAKINNNNYEKLVSVMSSTSYKEKIDSYEHAIDIYPEKTSAYIRMLEAYEEQGKFSKSENDEFLAVYNKNKDKFLEKDLGVEELNYKIGTMYFNYYTEQSDSYTFSNRVQKAYPFFEANYQNSKKPVDFKYKEISNCYYEICSFYKKYILSSAKVEEASYNDYEKLLGLLKNSLKSISKESAYDQLTLYNGVFMLLYDQRSNMASANVKKETILELMDLVHSKASKLTVQKEQSKELKKEITAKYNDYRDAINRIYINAEER
ncbi:MAG: serine/threonine-protein kinase [Inconstantimicrobium porci]|uniref:serine/threonine-protein kinase n=1 Tax=Inconstantimicrobium porci TaxID=2652291 RepID=UPI002A91CB41|nr:serine/threonine-protein kinase [Inconstantimicrobium porci]MDY5912418.1 serine/threonine-protein kinase [Inconstantimicrobium porci]